MKPVIGITCPWSYETWGDSTIDKGYFYVSKPYVEAVYKAGGFPLLLSPCFIEEEIGEDLEQLMERLDGILFTGGGNARRFTAENLPPLREQQEKRYDFERHLMKKAYATGIPILGICRGYQMIIEIFGGTLSENLIAEHLQSEPTYVVHHNVSLNKASKLYEIIEEENWKVNSLHIQKVEKIPEGFMVSAKTDDNVVEAVEAIDYPFLVGLQFHPELLYEDEKATRIFSWFIEEAKRYNIGG